MLMTAWSACIGLFPAAISTGIGSQVQRPLATVIVGGMLLGPVMLLVVVPALRMVFLRKDQDPEPWQPDRGDGDPGNAPLVEHIDDAMLVHREGDD